MSIVSVYSRSSRKAEWHWTFGETSEAEKRCSMSKMNFTNNQSKQTRVVEGVCMPIWHGDCDYDELLREAVRVALRMNMNPVDDDDDDLCKRIERLMAAYIASPEGEGEDSITLMTRLAVSIADAIPVEVRKGLVP